LEQSHGFPFWEDDPWIVTAERSITLEALHKTGDAGKGDMKLRASIQWLIHPAVGVWTVGFPAFDVAEQ
jgi:hypothetical protein